MDELIIEGIKFVSSKRAADLTGYAQDYVGQLARMGKISGRRVGRVWYVDENKIREHRSAQSEISSLKEIQIVPKSEENKTDEYSRVERNLIEQESLSAQLSSPDLKLEPELEPEDGGKQNISAISDTQDSKEEITRDDPSDEKERPYLLPQLKKSSREAVQTIEGDESNIQEQGSYYRTGEPSALPVSPMLVLVGFLFIGSIVLNLFLVRTEMVAVDGTQSKLTAAIPFEIQKLIFNLQDLKKLPF